MNLQERLKMIDDHFDNITLEQLEEQLLECGLSVYEEDEIRQYISLQTNNQSYSSVSMKEKDSDGPLFENMVKVA